MRAARTQKIIVLKTQSAQDPTARCGELRPPRPGVWSRWASGAVLGTWLTCSPPASKQLCEAGASITLTSQTGRRSQRGSITFPESHSRQAAKLGFEPRPCDATARVHFSASEDLLSRCGFWLPTLLTLRRTPSSVFRTEVAGQQKSLL